MVSLLRVNLAELGWHYLSSALPDRHGPGGGLGADEVRLRGRGDLRLTEDLWRIIIIIIIITTTTTNNIIIVIITNDRRRPMCPSTLCALAASFGAQREPQAALRTEPLLQLSANANTNTSGKNNQQRSGHALVVAGCTLRSLRTSRSAARPPSIAATLALSSACETSPSSSAIRSDAA